MGRSRAGFELLDWGDRRWKHGRDTCPLTAADRSRIAEYVAGKRFSCATQKIATPSAQRYSPTPKTVCVARLFSLACVGLGVREAARPSDGCMRKNGNTTVPMP
jgi:hypothetical protein